MNTDKDRVGVCEVELNVPALVRDDVDVDFWLAVMGGGSVIGPASRSQHLGDLIGGDLTHLQQILRSDVTPGFVLKRSIPQGLNDFWLYLQPTHRLPSTIYDKYRTLQACLIWPARLMDWPDATNFQL
jgi:hypothetical protein